MPMVQGKLCAKTISYVIFFVILLCISLAIVSEYRGDGEEALIHVLVDPSNGEINEILVGLLWLNCRQELNDFPLEKENIQNLFRHPALKQALSICMRKNDLIFQVSVEDGGFNPWYTRYVNSLYHRLDDPRRILASSNIAQAPDSDSAPWPSPDSAAWPSPYSAPATSPDFSPNPSPSKSPASSPSPSLPKASNQPPPLHDPNPNYRDSEYKGISKLTLATACIVTALVTAFVALFFFFLCFHKQINPRPISGDQQKLDDQPLGNEPILQKKALTNGGIAQEISLDGKSAVGVVAGTEASAESCYTNSAQSPGGASSPVPGVPPENGHAGGVDPLPTEPPNQVRAIPPPPPKPSGAPPRPPPPVPSCSRVPNSKNGPPRIPNATSGNDANSSKAKLKPFFWDKVAAKPDHAMVWNQLKSGSFQFNEELIQTLFGYSGTVGKKNNGKKESSAQEHAPQFVQLIDPKKAQNLAILLRALNVTTVDVCDALLEGNELPIELLGTLLKMAPTPDEERKLKVFRGEISQLGPAEQYLKQMLEIPFAFKRMELLLFMCSLNEEVAATKESFETLEVACKDLRGNRLFLKLLEAVLKTGNRMNDGTYRGGAQAFKLDTLLKLSDVKGVDGKTTLLHFVVQEIIRNEGLKAAHVERESQSFTSITSDDLLEDVSPDMEERHRTLGFQAVSGLSTELESVKKAAAVDAEILAGTVAKLGNSLLKARDFLNSEMKGLEEDSGFHEALKSFVDKADVDVTSLLEDEKRIMGLVKKTGSYFHGDNKKDEGLRLFVVVRDFLIILDKVCKEVKDKPVKSHRKGSNASSSSESRAEMPDLRQKLFPAITELKVDGSSSDGENY